MMRISQIAAGNCEDPGAETVFATFAILGYAMQRLDIDLSTKDGHEKTSVELSQ